MDEREKRARAESVEGRDLRDEEIGRIISAYEAKNPPPEIVPKRQWLLCTIGLVGSGKTTLLKRISGEMNLVRISNDDIRILLREGGYNFLRTIDIARRLTGKYLDEHRPIAFDGDSIIPENRKELQSMAEGRGIPLIFIHANPPEECIFERRRKAQYGPSDLFKNAEEAIADYYRRKPLHDRYLAEVVFNETFDTSRPDLSGQIDKFVKHLQEQGF